MSLEKWMYLIRLRLRSLFRRSQVGAELSEELQDHVERKIQEYVNKGLRRLVQLAGRAAQIRAFHRLLPVDNTLRVELAGTKLGQITLRLFPEYAARNSQETLDYEDRALVELLTDFTRVSERRVSPQFWRRNIAVMEATIELLSRTSSALKLLANVQASMSSSERATEELPCSVWHLVEQAPRQLVDRVD